MFTLKETYSLLASHNKLPREPLYHKFGCMTIGLKLFNFCGWLENGKSSHGIKFQRMGSKAPLCHNHEENMEHLLNVYPFTDHLWDQILYPFEYIDHNYDTLVENYGEIVTKHIQ